MENLPVVSIVIPSFNEENAIGQTVSRILQLRLPPFELIVVDDGSSDGTAAAARQAGARVVSHPYNIGNGASIKSGIRAARGKVIVFLDGDGQHDPDDIPRLLPYIAKYHMVVGARQRGSQTSWHRDMANWFYNKLASFVAEFKVEDLTSGFRIMRRADALRFCDMFPNRFSYPTTSTLAFVRSGRSLKYVPIQTRYRIGKSKIRLLHDGFEFLLIIAKIAMTYSPLRVFIPVSSFLFFLGLFRYAWTYFLRQQFTNMSQLLMSTSVLVFMLGLVAEQITALRFERGDRFYEPEDEALYAEFNNI